MEVGEDAQFLAADLFAFPVRKGDFHPFRMDGGSLELERFLGYSRILRDTVVVGGLGPAEDGVDAGDELGETEGLRDVVIAPHLKTLDAVGLAVLAGEENDRDINVLTLEFLDQFKAGMIRQGDVEEHQVGEIALEVTDHIGGPMMHLGEHSRGLQLIGNQVCQFGVIFND